MLQRIALLVCCLSLVSCAMPITAKAPAELKLENILKQDVDESLASGLEVIISYVEVPPRESLERHWHPGEEFAYLIAGEVHADIDGHPKMSCQAGEAAHIPFQAWHSATTGSDGARFVVFRVHRKGEPIRHLESSGAQPR